MSSSSSSVVHASVLSSVLVWALLPGCGGGNKNSAPTGPTVAASPSPTPSPIATPPPTGGNAAYPASCRGLPAGRGTASGCTRGAPRFLGRVTDAVNLSRGSTYRDPATGQAYQIVLGNNQIQVASAYLQTVIDALDRQGTCAVYDGEEINVRDGGGYNENYDIITADGGSWVGYSVTCTPEMPIPALPPPPPQKTGDCRLAASASIFCHRAPLSYDFEIYDAQDLLIAEDRARSTPLIFNFNDRFSTALPYAYKIVNDSMYVSEMLKKIKAKGFCAIYDGDEFQLKRNNVFTEHYDMTRADGYAIRLYGSTCRDAAF